MKGLIKIATATLLVSILLLAVLPFGLYFYTLSLLDEMPEHSAIKLSDTEVTEMWENYENCTQSQCSSITPYWIYHWFFGAVINDFITPIDTDAIYANVSRMASQIAIHHMREGHFKGKGMGWWHLTHASLSIWLQRNWEDNEIASRYREIGA